MDLVGVDRARRAGEMGQQGLKFQVVNDQAVFTRAAVDDVQRNLYLAIILTAMVLMLFLHSLRNTLMVLVAIPFALQSPRGGRMYGIALAIGIMVVYTVVDYSARAFARAELLPPLLAAWTANIIFLGIGTSLFLRART